MGSIKGIVLVLVLVVISFVKTKNFGVGINENKSIEHDFQTNDTKIINCPTNKESIDEFPSDIFSQFQRIHGAIIFHLIIGFYCFVLIAFVCNDYFLPSVFCICQDLHLSPDVAGATFMSTATCTPELFVNIIGTYLTKSDLGIGAVNGNAVNILVITACAGLAASKNIKLEVWPLLRDSGTYIIVVGLLAVILVDGVVQWYEALVLCILYFVYFTLMLTQNRIKTVANKILPWKNSLNSTSSMNAIMSVPAEHCYGTYKPFYIGDYVPHGHEHGSHNHNSHNEKPPQQNKEGNNEKQSIDEIEPICSPPGGFLMNIWWLLSVPVSLVLSVSIPDCKKYRKIYPLTFIMCIVWIGISSYIVSWMMTIFGYTFHINDAVMGTTFIAIGGSIPETSSAIINARKNGIGSMSISNALGASTLDILLCLGGPWLMKTLLPVEIGGGPITLETRGLTFNCLCLIVSVVTLNIVTYCNSFHMNRVYGFICLLCYFIFVTLLILSDMNILFNFGTNACS
ncbi:sodium/potassium/calcium exchanger 4-like [Planococcus citri]|uniref:sodium/potassium/calcium exchanger 4-like n=1 Tax=Planococcus citri TaxID=170843 RepID=UPI0031F8AFED